MEIPSYLVKKIKHYLELQANRQDAEKDELAEQLLRELHPWQELEQERLQPQPPAGFPCED